MFSNKILIFPPRLNGDMAVLPVSGVASVYPKMESLSEDFAKVLNDWQEHLGFLEVSFNSKKVKKIYIIFFSIFKNFFIY